MSNFLQTRDHKKTPLILAMALLGGLVIVGLPATAQYIEPNGLPPGGRAAVYLDTSDTAQTKAGSLIIGDGDDELCLNNPGDCLSGWTLGTGSNDNYVIVNQADYDSAKTQIGYARLIGNGLATQTFKSDEGSNTSITQTGIYASDYGDPTSWAGYFNGSFVIGRHLNWGPLGKLCLNSSADYIPDELPETPGYGCIENWTDLDFTTTDYVRVQPNNPPTLQVGGAWLGNGATDTDSRPGAWQFDSAVVGGVVPGVGLYCGDGLCSAEVNEDAVSCAYDCGVRPEPEEELPDDGDEGGGGWIPPEDDGGLMLPPPIRP